MRYLLTAILCLMMGVGFGQAPVVGDYYGGGVVFWVNPDDNMQGLVCDIADLENANWGCEGESINGADDLGIGYGLANTIAIVNDCSENGIAAKLCSDYANYGFDDWYLPSINELEQIYLHKDIINSVSVELGGDTLIDHVSYDSENNWISDYYVSSTEWTSAWCYIFNFDQGIYQNGSKDGCDLCYHVRAVRSYSFVSLGCTDPTASNYDSNATEDDGSCEYQKTYVPDDNFEQSLIDQGYDDVLDDYVLTQNINNVDFIDLSWSNISSLTGIEDFTMLSVLLCHHNEIDEISLCSNYALTYLRCNDNLISSIDLSQNLDLNLLRCNNNQLTHLDLTSNVNLTQLYSFSNSSLNCLQVWEIDYVYEQMEQNCIDPIDGGSLPCFQIDSGLNVSLDCNYEVQEDCSCSGVISTTCIASDCCISGTQWDLNTMTCVYEDACSADIAKDGFVAVDDLLELLSAFGSSCDEVATGIGGEECVGAECCGENTIWCETLEICIPFISCPADLNEDESIGVDDLLTFLISYGGACEEYESLPDCEVTASPWMCGDLIEHEGYDYSTVLIGEQCWFSENCRYLPVVSWDESSETQPYYYVSEYEGTNVEEAKATDNYDTYGVLYNWPAVKTEGICPSGWNVPSDEEFTELTDFFGGETVAGGMMKETGYDHWNSPNTGATNSSGWTGLPGGYAYFGNFDNYNNYGHWWSASEYSTATSRSRRLDTVNDNVYSNIDNNNLGYSARCIKD